MKKSVFKLKFGFALSAVIFLQLFCGNIDSPSAPNKTNASVVFMSSTSKIYEGALVDSVGKEIRVGTALYLPANFDSVAIQILDNGNTVIDTVFKTFKSEPFMDTVWVKHTFLKPGVKNVTITPFSNPERTAIGATITILGIEKIPEDKTPPVLSFVTPSDTNATISVDTFTIDLLCSDSSGVASVSAGMGFKTFQSTLKDGHYMVQITGFTRGEINVVTITAKDSSASGNPASQKFFFNYTASTYSVKYQKGSDVSGELPVDSRMYQGGEQAIVMGNTGNLIKSGCTFSGWNTKEDGSGTLYTGGSTFKMGNADMVLFAQWTANSVHKVVYNGNGNTGGNIPADSNNYIASSTVTVKDNTGSLTKTGATFKGWNTVVDGSGTAYAGGVTFAMGNADVVLYAQWTTNPTFTVTYDGNGNTTGTVPVDANKYETSATVTVKINTGFLVKTGATFAGWNTKADGSGTSYDVGSTLVMGSANDTLFAKWTQKQNFALTITAINGSVTKVPDLATYDSGTVVTLTPIPATGYHFTGWSGALSGTTNPASVTMNSAKSVTAEFAINQVNSFALTVLATNGMVKKTPDLPQYDSGCTVGLKATPTAGFSFVNWTGDATGTTDSTTVVMSAAKSITANFAPVTYQLTVSAGTVGTITAPAASPVAVNHGAKTTITASPNSGYRFSGWSVTSGTATFDDASLTSTSVTLSSGNATVTASFTRITYQLTLVAETGGTISTPSSPATVNHGAATTITATPNSGYNFNGWVVTSGNAAIPDLSLATTTVTLTSGNAEIKALWTTIPYSITYTLNGGDQNGGSYPSTYTVNTSTITLPSPTKTPYVFDGWYENSGLSGNKVTSIPNRTTGNKTLFAKWAIKDIDGNSYTEVKIGNQYWMVENFRCTKYNDGTSIPQLTDTQWIYSADGAYCYYNNTTSALELQKWGALYNWYVVNTGKLAPAGWHVPTDAEWTVLENYLIANGFNYDGSTSDNKIAKSMAAKTDWATSSFTGDIGNDLITNNASGFSALPGGYRGSGGTFLDQSYSCYWWSVTEFNESIGRGRNLNSGGNYLRSYSINKRSGFSVRLVKD